MVIPSTLPIHTAPVLFGTRARRLGSNTPDDPPPTLPIAVTLGGIRCLAGVPPCATLRGRRW